MNRSVGIKGLIVGLLTLVIWIALLLVNGLISDRQRYRDEAVQSIAESYAGPQMFVGPVLVQPFQKQDTVATGPDKKMVVTTATHDGSALTFPLRVSLDAVMNPAERRHGLYRAAVYTSEIKLKAEIDAPPPDVAGATTFGEPYLAFSLSDVRGIVGTPVVTVNGVSMAMTQGGLIRGAVEELSPEPHERGPDSLSTPQRLSSETPQHSWQPNLRVRLLGAPRGKAARYTIELVMQLAGTQKLSIAPVGDGNRIDMRSAWSSPLFAGRFLPRSPELGPDGFHATWDLSSLAAATQQQIIADASNVDALSVSLLTPIDPYKLSDRASKYGILLVVLTFGGFFLFEMMRQLPIHPIQYLLVGFGLAIFFLLLISFSEHMAFALAYVLASVACIGLLGFYLSFVLHSVIRGATFAAMLATLYAAVYGLLISEDNALLLGALLLFAVLATVIFVTRKVNWYQGGAEWMRVRRETAAGGGAGVAPPPAP